MQPPIGAIVTGTTDSANATFFSGFSRPTSSSEAGIAIIASSGSGDRVGIVGAFGQLSVARLAMCTGASSIEQRDLE